MAPTESSPPPTVTSGRRLAEAAHELRRPLQILALAFARARPIEPAVGAELIEQAHRALLALERELAGAPAAHPPADRAASVDLESLAEAARRRWQGVVEVELERAGAGAPPQRAVVAGDPGGLAAAVDNLIANAVEHGERPVKLRVERAGERERLVVINRRRASPGDRAGRASPGGRGERDASDPRRGHGLAIAARAAAEHGGELRPPLDRGAVTEATLELPAGGAP